MMWLHLRLTIRCLILVPLLAGGIWMLNRRLKQHQRSAMDKGAKVESQFVEIIEAVQTIKAFRAESRVHSCTEAQFGEMLDASLRAQQVAAHSTTLSSLIVGISTTGLFWFGGHEVLIGGSTTGQLMAFYTMLGMVLGPIERLATANQSIQEAITAADRLGEVLELEVETKKQKPHAVDRAITGFIQFQDVTFGYGSRPPIFEKLNLEIQSGECLGIIGESGCGKTTLTQLLGRFLEPTTGRIHIDGIDITDYTFNCLRRQIVFVPQDIVLLNATIADNIRLGRPDASSREIIVAAEAASLTGVIDRLPHGYNTMVGERGVALSGGQRQRIAIARAMLLNPSILVLDEPTSHLDSQSELAVQALIDQRRGICTTVVVSHRPLNVSRMVEFGEICKLPVPD
jgi:subfamily B ATP-binding cassette protein MsbA